MGEETFNGRGVQDFLALFEKNIEKINMKTFYLLKMRSCIYKLNKHIQIYKHIRGLPPRNASLFTLKYF